MSELDFEDEVNENKTASSCEGEQTSSTMAIEDQANEVECSEMPQNVSRNSEEGEIESDQSDAGEVSNSDHDLADLEEGEINDESTEGLSSVLCRFFQNGNCRYGKQCRFVHIGASAYKMFETKTPTKNFHFTIRPQQVYCTQSKLSSQFGYSERNDGSAWEQGLEEAKKLLLIAKDKKETDVEFEDKKLYLQTEKDIDEMDRKSALRKRHSSDKKKKKHSTPEVNFERSPSEYIEKETKSKKDKHRSKSNKVCSEVWTDPWRRSRSRTRKQSRSSSSSISSRSSRHWTPKSSSSSICSMCSSDDKEKHSDCERRSLKAESKLQRVFSRTFSRSRSRKRTLSYSRSPSKSRVASLKRSLYRSYSRSRSSSSSTSSYSKKNSVKNVIVKSFSKFEQPSSSSKIRSPKQHKRKRSPESPISNRWLKETASSDCESYSSDLTVSSITCTTFSGTRSSVDSGSVKRDKVTTCSNSFNKKSVHSNETVLQKYQKNHSVRGSTNDKYDNRESASSKPKSSDRIAPDVSVQDKDRKTSIKRDSPVSYKYEYRESTSFKPKPSDTIAPDVSVQAKDRKTAKKDSPVSNKKLDRNQNITVEKKNTFENELLKYLPSKERRAAAKPKVQNPAKSTETTITPKKISISLKPKPKFVPTKSILSSPVKKSPPKVVDKPLSRREQLLRQLEAVELAIAKKKKLA